MALPAHPRKVSCVPDGVRTGTCANDYWGFDVNQGKSSRKFGIGVMTIHSPCHLVTHPTILDESPFSLQSTSAVGGGNLKLWLEAPSPLPSPSPQKSPSVRFQIIFGCESTTDLRCLPHHKNFPHEVLIYGIMYGIGRNPGQKRRKGGTAKTQRQARARDGT